MQRQELGKGVHTPSPGGTFQQKAEVMRGREKVAPNSSGSPKGRHHKQQINRVGKKGREPV